MASVEPSQFFDAFQLQESLVLRFRYRPRNRLLDLVVSYAAEAVSDWFAHLESGGTAPSYSAPPRHFLWIRFDRVSSLSSQTHKTSDEDIWRDYESQLIEKPVVISAIEFTEMDPNFELRIAMPSFGWHTLSFRGMSIKERFGLSKQIGPKNWEYVDPDTQKPFAFDNPFPEIDTVQ